MPENTTDVLCLVTFALLVGRMIVSCWRYSQRTAEIAEIILAHGRPSVSADPPSDRPATKAQRR